MIIKNKLDKLIEIKKFFDGENDDIKYMVALETDKKNPYGICYIDDPEKGKLVVKRYYEPFIFVKDLEAHNINLYRGDEQTIRIHREKHGIKIKKLEDRGQDRLENGFIYQYSSTKSLNDIKEYFKDGGCDLDLKKTDSKGKLIRTADGRPIYLNSHLFYMVKTDDQFLIYNDARFFKGFDEYNQVHRLIFDIETTSLRVVNGRIFAIGLLDNRGYKKVLFAEKLNDDDSEIELIENFFKEIVSRKHCLIGGYNSEDFDFEFIIGRAKELDMNLYEIETTEDFTIPIQRWNNASFKYGNTTKKYTATKIYGKSVYDINHATIRASVFDTDMKNTSLKYIAKYADVAKTDRTYINGENNGIFKMYDENKPFICDNNNNYYPIPIEFENIGIEIYELKYKEGVTKEDVKNKFFENRDFLIWYKSQAKEKNITKILRGRDILTNYLLDDIEETDRVDLIYSQASFLLTKMIPTTYSRVTTMGTAAIWDLLMTLWSYKKGIAIPDSDVTENFVGGLARTFTTGYVEDLSKIDFASLYPMSMLEFSIFPLFDVENALMLMLMYSTTTRNIYKKLNNGDDLTEEELYLLKNNDNHNYKLLTGEGFTDAETKNFKLKQLPLKTFNNTLFGALGSGISFHWSDNRCAARITSSGRLLLRNTMVWFRNIGVIPTLMVTDGINFKIPQKTKYRIINSELIETDDYIDINEAWSFEDKKGIDGLIDYYNKIVLNSKYIAVDNDGEYKSAINISRINYATLSKKIDKKTNKGKIKLTGNSIKSKTIPAYIEEFLDSAIEMILNGDGYGFYELYKKTVLNILIGNIDIFKIANKSRIKQSIDDYINRGEDKNGREKGKQAHMELIYRKKLEEAYDFLIDNLSLFNLSIEDFNKMTPRERLNKVKDYIPIEVELDSVIYYYNSGNIISDGYTKPVSNEINPKTGLVDIYSKLCYSGDDADDYNKVFYIKSLNNKIKPLLCVFNEEVQSKILYLPTKKKKSKRDLDVNNNVSSMNLEDFPVFGDDDLKLVTHTLDDINEALTMEAKEIKFWNRYGFNPNKISNIFKVPEDQPLNYDDYLRKYDIVNNFFKSKKGENFTLKKEDDIWEEGDYILFRNGEKYMLGRFNGAYVEWIRKEMKF